MLWGIRKEATAARKEATAPRCRYLGQGLTKIPVTIPLGTP